MRLGKGLNIGRGANSPIEIIDILEKDLTYGWTLPGSVQTGDILLVLLDQYNYGSTFTDAFDQTGFATLDTHFYPGSNEYGCLVAWKLHDGDATITMDPTGISAYYVQSGSRLAILRKPGATNVAIADGDSTIAWGTGNPANIETLASAGSVPCFSYAGATEYRSGAYLRSFTTSPSIPLFSSNFYNKTYAAVFNEAGEKIDSHIDPPGGASSSSLIIFKHWLFNVT